MSHAHGHVLRSRYITPDSMNQETEFLVGGVLTASWQPRYKRTGDSPL